MRSIRRTVRLLRLLVHAGWGALLTAVLAGILRLTPEHSLYQRVAQRWLGQIVRLLGGRVQVYGEPAPPGTLLVANHISWLDVPLLGGCTQVQFLSKSEIRQWPVIGWLAAKSGTLFIQRGGPDAARAAAATMRQRLEQGGRVLIFPEGTTTDGVKLLPFHARLFAAAVEATAPVQPVAIHYRDTAGRTHPSVPYINDQSLMDNLWAILSEPYILIEVHFLPLVDSSTLPRKALAAYSEVQIKQVLYPPLDQHPDKAQP